MPALNPNDDITPLTYTLDQAAIVSGISTSTLRRKTDAGEAPRLMQTGKRSVYLREEIDAWVRSGFKMPKKSKAKS